jgi:hypothetical protein
LKSQIVPLLSGTLREAYRLLWRFEGRASETV